jgi:hypothetical protein
MFELPKPGDDREYSDYEKWAQTFAEASARLEALERAVSSLRHVLRCSDAVHSADILEVLDRHHV